MQNGVGVRSFRRFVEFNFCRAAYLSLRLKAAPGYNKARMFVV
jgi:hypothetical protein